MDPLTLSIALAILGGFVAWSLAFNSLPLIVSAPLGSLLLTWYGSLQHETIHGHPTRSRRLNSVIGGVPLSLWVPYAVYRETHMQHHRHPSRRLTEVDHDPESFYLAAGTLAQVGPVRRALLKANCTLAGRLIIGPALSVHAFWSSELRKVIRNPRRGWIWLRHGIAVSLVLLWVHAVAGIPLWFYALCVVYPSIALTHLRSFAEHRADDQSDQRTNVVEAGALWSLLFLNNNLHVAHHAHPHVSWHKLPRLWHAMRGEERGAGVVFTGGYREVMSQYLFRPFITAEHPFSSADLK